MSKKKKKNHVVHLKQSHVKNMKEDATNEGLKGALIIFFTVMRDKEGYGKKRLKRIFNHATDLADSMQKGYVKMADLEKVLADEADITFHME